MRSSISYLRRKVLSHTTSLFERSHSFRNRGRRRWHSSVTLGVDQNLGVRLGIAERVEGIVDAVEPDGPGDKRGDVDLAVGDHVQRVAEFHWRVTEYEAQVDL